MTVKRSSKKYRNQKKKDQKKKLLATGMMVCLGTFPVWSNDNVLLTIIPGMSKAFGSNLGIDYDYGVGAKLTYRKGDNLDFFLEADYKRLSLPNVSPIDLVNVNAGAGYHFNFNERFGLNVSAQAGAYMGSKSGGMVTGPSGGISVSFTYRINPVVSVEAGANVGHYAATPTPLMTEVGGTAAVTLNLTEAMTNVSRIKMETNEMLPVFPVLYSWYKNNAFATVGITNQEDAAIEDVTVSFYQSQYMNQPNVCKKIPKLGKGETIDAELTAFFNERMLDLTEKTDTEAIVIIEYSYLGRKKKKEIGMVVPVYGRNSMSWDDDRRAAVFVSSKDPAALWFSKYISSIVRDNARPESLGNNYPGVSQNIQYAMGIFETLDQFGLNYVIDPSSAYSDNIGGASIDFLQFPYQTLTYRGGDCDDISILVCSLFEAVGIKTGFITIPGHIFIAFDSGMTMQEAGQSMMNTSNLFDMKGDGEAWIPLEITLTDEGFSRAWKVGAREWSTTAEGDRMFYAMEDCWKLYDPVSVPGATANFTLPDKNVVTRLFQHSMDNWIAKEISPIVAQYNARLAMNDTVELRNELGILYGQYGLFVEADDQFKRARRKGYVPSLLNTANIYFARKQFQIALEWYRQVLEKEPENNLAILGVARCQYELENFDECDLAYDWLRNKNPELANEYRYLGAFEQTTGRSYSLADRLTLTKWDRGEYSSGIVNDGSYEEIAEANSREDENGFVTSDATSSTLVDSETEQLFTQIADMTNPDSALRPDAAIVDTKTYDRVPTDRYASLDDPATLVQELPGLIAQLRLPETKFDNTDPVMISDYQLIASTSTGGKPVTDTSSSIIVEERPSTAQTTTTPKTDSVPHVAETKTETLPFVTTTVPETKPEEKPSVDTNKLGRKEVVAVVPKTTETSIAEQKPSSTTSTTGTSETTVVESASTVETPVEIVQTHVEEKAPVAEQKPSSTTATTGTTVVESTGSVETPVEIAQTHVEEKAPVAEQKPSSTTSTTGTTETTVVESASTVEAPVEIAQTHVEEKTPIVEQNPSSTNTSTETTVAESTSSVETPVEIAQTHVEEKAPIVEQKPSSTTSTTGTTETTVAESASTVEPPVEIAQTHVEEKAPIVEQKPSSTNISTETTVVESASTVETPVELAQTHVEDETPVVEQKPSSTNTSTETTVVESASSVETPVELAQTHVEEKTPIAEQKPSSTNTSTATTGTTHVEQTSSVETPVEVAQTHVEEKTPIVEQKPSSTNTGTEETPLVTVETVVEEPQIDEWENDFFEAVVNTPNEKKEDKPAVAVNLYEDDPDVEEWNDWDDWDDDELFDALMNPPNFDDFAGTPIASLKNDDIIEDIKTASELFNTDKGSEVAIGPSLPKDEIIERAAPRYTETETSKWVPDEVYQAKTIPGMKTFEEEMALYSDDKSWLYEEEPERLSDDTEDAIALELWKEAQAQAKIEEKKKAEESFGQNIETLEDLASMFSYLDDNVLEEIQHTTLIDKINEQAAKKMDPTAKAKNNDEEILEEIRRMREEKEAEEKAEREAEKHSRPNVGLLHKAEQISSTVSEPDEKIEQPVENLVHEQEHIANLVEEMEPTKLEEVSNVGLDIDTKEKTKFNAGPYIAGGLGLVGLFVLFLLIFVKRDDDDDDDKKKKEGPANA